MSSSCPQYGCVTCGTPRPSEQRWDWISIHRATDCPKARWGLIEAATVSGAELRLIADVLAWTEGFDCTCDDECTGDAWDRVWQSANDCAEHLAKHCEDRA